MDRRDALKLLGAVGIAESLGGVLPREEVAARTLAAAGIAADLDDDARQWRITTDPPPELQWPPAMNVPAPGRSGVALSAGVPGGKPGHRSPHYYTTISPSPAQPLGENPAFALSLWFRFSATTWANCGGRSRIQALEFVVGRRHGRYDWEFAAQWMNVGEGANDCGGRPRWRLWTGDSTNDERAWSETGLEQKLTPDTWHSLTLRGYIQPARPQAFVKYMDLICNEDARHFGTGQAYSPVQRTQLEQLYVAFQPDANENGDSYDVLLDKVSLIWLPFNPW